jgi:pimeloyl-ACP methyl ester carboxylesterase
MLSRLFGGRAAPAMALPGTPVSLHYSVSRTRWHMDNRDPTTVLLLHDVAGCGKSWSRVLSSVARLPVDGHTPVTPLDVYCPDLRNHGASPHAAAHGLLEQAHDVARFVETVVEWPERLHVVGRGVGGRVALLAALARPDMFASVTSIDAVPCARADTNASPALALRFAVQALGVDPRATAADVDKALAKAMPRAADRHELLLSFREATDADDKARWALNTDVLAAAETLEAVSAWPAFEGDAPVCDKPVHLVTSQAADAAPALSPAVLALFPQAKRVSVDHANPALLCDAVLRNAGLLGAWDAEAQQ